MNSSKSFLVLQIMYSLLFACLLTRVSSDNIISTSTGPIRGIPSVAADVTAYLGIPYAEPPVGELRFARPVPKKAWTDTYNASTLGPPCLQIDFEPFYYMPDLTNMSEDCLYLNIWAPNSEPTDGLRPIIIYLHPGGFITGSSTIEAHDGSHLANRGDLVVASLNYRLGAFGYLLAYIEEANGNMGEFDKLMAITWIKENAKSFNGDPDNIILMGASAGAASISGFLVSPLTKHLYKRVIIISGSSMHPYLSNNDRLFKNSEKVASLVGCVNATMTLKSDPQNIVKCLKNKPGKDLVEVQSVLLMSSPLTFFQRVNDDFLPKSIIQLYHEGKFRNNIDVLMGITENEGGLYLFSAIPQYVGFYGENVKTMTKVRALAMSRGAIMISGQGNASEVIDYYMKHVKNRSAIGYVKMIAYILGDFATSCSTIFNADIVSLKGNPVYFYKFNFRPVSTPTAEWVGSTHLDDVQYIFQSPYQGNFTKEEIDLSHNLIDRWSAFARTGNPNIRGHIPWLRYTYHNPVYLNIGQEEESIRLRPNSRCEIWRKRFKADFDEELIRNLRNSDI